jgi:hypothetical protein
MSDIKKVTEGLELIEIVVPSYKHARRKGLTDDEAETVVNWALEQAIILLEQLIGAMYSKENTTEGGAGSSESLHSREDHRQSRL